MNWVGGSRARVRKRLQSRQTDEFFERREREQRIARATPLADKPMDSHDLALFEMLRKRSSQGVAHQPNVVSVSLGEKQHTRDRGLSALPAMHLPPSIMRTKGPSDNVTGVRLALSPGRSTRLDLGASSGEDDEGGELRSIPSRATAGFPRSYRSAANDAFSSFSSAANTATGTSRSAHGPKVHDQWSQRAQATDLHSQFAASSLSEWGGGEPYEEDEVRDNGEELYLGSWEADASDEAHTARPPATRPASVPEWVDDAASTTFWSMGATPTVYPDDERNEHAPPEPPPQRRSTWLRGEPYSQYDQLEDERDFREDERQFTLNVSQQSSSTPKQQSEGIHAPSFWSLFAADGAVVGLEPREDLYDELLGHRVPQVPDEDEVPLASSRPVSRTRISEAHTSRPRPLVAAERFNRVAVPMDSEVGFAEADSAGLTGQAREGSLEPAEPYHDHGSSGNAWLSFLGGL